MLILAAVLCSVAVSVLLKVARRYQLDIRQSIAMNYAIAVLLCMVLLRPQPATLLRPESPWWVLLALGVLLPSIFLAMAAAVRHAGIVRSDAAQRLSLCIPLAASFIWFGETLTLSKGLGMALGLAALAGLLARSESVDTGTGSPATPNRLWAPLSLLCVWVGYGVIDILFKTLARAGAAFAASLLVTFVLAGLLLTGYLLVRRVSWHRASLAAGALLGLLNFGNIYFYIRAHQVYPDNPTLVFTAMNIGVITVGTLVGAGIFRERLNRWNALGILLAIAAIAALMPR